MGKYANFRLEEFIRSNEATKRGIDNTPSFEVVDNLNELISNVLQPLRTAWGKPLIISSGYRCSALNKVVKGSATSVHMLGYAADVQVASSKDFNAFVKFAEDWLRKNRVAFDQSIRETSGDKYWWHIGLKNNNGGQRRQFKAMTV